MTWRELAAAILAQPACNLDRDARVSTDGTGQASTAIPLTDLGSLDDGYPGLHTQPQSSRGQTVAPNVAHGRTTKTT